MELDLGYSLPSGQAPGIWAIDIDELIFGSRFTRDYLQNSTVFKVHPPAPEDVTYQLPYLFGVSELEDHYPVSSRAQWAVNAARGGKGAIAGLIIATLYVTIIFSIQHWMRSRPAYNLRGYLISWNLALFLFSILGTLRCAPEFFDVWRRHGFVGTLCNGRLRHTPTELWGWAFVFSKVFEMVDTVFIVLRKQRLIFLHWFHHLLTMLYTWFFMIFDSNAPGRWFMLMNFTVHSFMYGYYALRASRLYRIPRWVNVAITTAQIAQMFVGFAISSTTWYVKASAFRGMEEQCHVTYANLVTVNLMYTAYIALFLHFFYHAYLRPNTTTSPQQLKSKQANGVTPSDLAANAVDVRNNNNSGTRHPTHQQRLQQILSSSSSSLAQRENTRLWHCNGKDKSA